MKKIIKRLRGTVEFDGRSYTPPLSERITDVALAAAAFNGLGVLLLTFAEMCVA